MHENLTIFTDLSMDATCNAAGIGIWMRGSDFKHSYGITLTIPLSGSAEGETIGAVMGLAAAVQNAAIQKCTQVIFVLDNQHAVDLINGDIIATRDWEIDAITTIKAIVDYYGVVYRANKIKAHAGTSTPRNWVNDHVDRIAKKHMRIARNNARK